MRIPPIFSLLFIGIIANAQNGGPLSQKNIYLNKWENDQVKEVSDTLSQSTIFNLCDTFSDSTCTFIPKTGFELGSRKEFSFIKLNLNLGSEFRNEFSKDRINSFEYGLQLSGIKGDLHFWLNSRIYSEIHSAEKFKSTDGEFVETQEKGNGSNFSFASFSRYTTDIYLQTNFGQIGFQRKSFHWGPGQLHNLVFSEYAPNFPAFYFKSNIAFFNFQTLFGNLSKGLDGEQRFIYAHRYELDFNFLLIGVTEQLVSYKHSVPSAAVPIVPLFMEKGQSNESQNNGNLALDISFKPISELAIYGEFLVDDLQEPSSLFNDFWANKWALMGGVKYIKPQLFDDIDFGFINEYTRVEPYVYTHYIENTAQSTNRSLPLGFEYGPNSQAFSNYLFLTKNQEWSLGLRYDHISKGRNGGDVNAPTDSLYQRYLSGKLDDKVFLDNSKNVQRITPSFNLYYGLINFYGSYRVGINETDLVSFRVFITY